jgi:hypothetical protein
MRCFASIAIDNPIAMARKPGSIVGITGAPPAKQGAVALIECARGAERTTTQFITQGLSDIVHPASSSLLPEIPDRCPLVRGLRYNTFSFRK